MSELNEAYPTTLERSENMYSLNSGYVHWYQWAEKFVEKCKKLGWEVECGPGTSLGAVMVGARGYSDGSTVNTLAKIDLTPYQSSGWDCDWTQENGINPKWLNTDYKGAALYDGWFYGLSVWPTEKAKENNGIDEDIGRFDFIVYTGKSNNNNEKIGFRVKYPVCSVGYKKFNLSSYLPLNYIYGVPIFTLYSDYNKEIEQHLPEASQTEGNFVSSDTYDNLAKGYIYVYSKLSYNKIMATYRQYSEYKTANLITWFKTTKNNNFCNLNPPGIIETLIWNKDLETEDSFAFSPNHSSAAIGSSSGGFVLGSTSGYPYYSYYTNRLFKNNWYKYNKFNYHISEDGYTTYMYISDAEGNIGIKLIATTLENGEKAIMIERRDPNENGDLCEMAAVTGSNLYTQPSGNYLIKCPKRPYKKIVSGTGQFTFSKMLIPTQTSLCKDLFYVTKKDINKTIGKEEYVYVTDKKKNKHYFKVFPFGSKMSYEVQGDNTTYLAFPVKSPIEEVDNNG